METQQDSKKKYFVLEYNPRTGVFHFNNNELQVFNTNGFFILSSKLSAGLCIEFTQKMYRKYRNSLWYTNGKTPFVGLLQMQNEFIEYLKNKKTVSKISNINIIKLNTKEIMKNEVIKKYTDVLTDIHNAGAKGLTMREIADLCGKHKTDRTLSTSMKKMGLLRLLPNQNMRDKGKLRVVLSASITDYKLQAIPLYEYNRKYHQESVKRLKDNESKMLPKSDSHKIDNLPTKDEIIDITRLISAEYCITYLKERGYKIMKPVYEYIEV